MKSGKGRYFQVCKKVKISSPYSTCSMDMQHGDMDKQSGQAAWRGNMYNCTCSMDIQRGHVALTCSVHIQHGHAAWTCGVEMQNGHAE
jgi:hypothetical protein